MQDLKESRGHRRKEGSPGRDEGEGPPGSPGVESQQLGVHEQEGVQGLPGQLGAQVTLHTDAAVMGCLSRVNVT